MTGSVHTRSPWARSLLRPRSALLVLIGLVLSLLGGGVSWGATPTYNPVADVGSMYNTTLSTGAQSWWQAGYTGAGVDVAVVDTGVTPVPGLDAPGKVVYGPDLSFESQAPNLIHLDTNGHGTHLAGIVAGRGDGAVSGSYAGDASDFLGMAPDARILSLKVGIADGAVDVSQVIAAIDWVVQHRTDDGLNVRVLLLAFGTDSLQPYQVDPLAFAVEQAWKSGIFVVAAAGNRSFAARGGTMTDPAYDPKILAVGASDSRGTVNPRDDKVASFSSGGSFWRYPDVVAPGTHIVSLRVPGSYIDQTAGKTGYVTDQLFRGSGTSQAAAVVAGAAALAIQKYPSITPDSLKGLFQQNTTLLRAPVLKQGRGEINLDKMLSATPPQGVPWSSARFPWSTGTGSLDRARGRVAVLDHGVPLRGEQDIFGHPFDSDVMAALEAAGSSWSGGIWNGSVWTGSSWSGSSWSGSSWSGSSWSGSSWSGNSWSGNSWSGNSWSGNSWSGNSWSGNSWSGNSWSGNSWSGNSWSADDWCGLSWG